MKKYIVPELEVIKINEDVITTSGEAGKNETGMMGAGDRYDDDFWGKKN